MGTIIHLAIVVFVIALVLILRSGNLSFWRTVSRYPEEATGLFLITEGWHVFVEVLPQDYKQQLPPGEWDGPFIYIDPAMGGIKIYVFGKKSKYEKSQKELARKIRFHAKFMRGVL